MVGTKGGAKRKRWVKVLLCTGRSYLTGNLTLVYRLNPMGVGNGSYYVKRLGWGGFFL